MGDLADLENIGIMEANAKAIPRMNGDPNARVNIQRIPANIKQSYDVEIADERRGLIKDAYRFMGAT